MKQPAKPQPKRQMIHSDAAACLSDLDEPPVFESHFTQTTSHGVIVVVEAAVAVDRSISGTA